MLTLILLGVAVLVFFAFASALGTGVAVLSDLIGWVVKRDGWLYLLLGGMLAVIAWGAVALIRTMTG